MIMIPNTETVRHLCHFHGGSRYYLSAGTTLIKPTLVTDVKNLNLLTTELQSWCGMSIDVFSTEATNERAIYTIKHGTALHLAADKMKLTEE